MRDREFNLIRPNIPATSPLNPDHPGKLAVHTSSTLRPGEKIGG